MTVPHRRCECSNWDQSLHIGAAHCPAFEGPSAHCASCHGCKFCRLVDERPFLAGLHLGRRLLKRHIQAALAQQGL